jgi:hypothetical protein
MGPLAFGCAKENSAASVALSRGLGHAPLRVQKRGKRLSMRFTTLMLSMLAGRGSVLLFDDAAVAQQPAATASKPQSETLNFGR